VARNSTLEIDKWDDHDSNLSPAYIIECPIIFKYTMKNKINIVPKKQNKIFLIILCEK
jgi:hypothetical protein